MSNSWRCARTTCPTGRCTKALGQDNEHTVSQIDVNDDQAMFQDCFVDNATINSNMSMEGAGAAKPRPGCWM